MGPSPGTVKLCEGTLTALLILILGDTPTVDLVVTRLCHECDAVMSRVSRECHMSRDHSGQYWREI